MEKDKIKKEILKLREEVNFHNYKYYVENNPVISDYEYDQLLKKLEKLEKENPEFKTEDSPTQRVGGQPVEGFKTVEHMVPMLSLANTYTYEELREFDERVKKYVFEVEYVVEPKIDGVSVALIYKNGIFIRGATRGDGKKGDDITQNIKTIHSIPLRLIGNVLKNVEVRGEIYMSISAFKRYNHEQEKKGQVVFSNPRNASAGSLRQLNPSVVSKRPLDIFMYFISYSDKDLKTQENALNSLKEAGFKINPLVKKVKNIEEAIKYCEKLERLRDTLDYEIDGAVLKVNSLAQHKILGETSKNPRWSISYKFTAKQSTTRLNNIDLQVGRTGVLTPVAILEPVEVGGVIVSRATLHNFDELNRKDIRIGDYVLIERSGDVIPQVVKSIKEKRTGEEKRKVIPRKCPICQTEVIRSEGEVAIRCPNKTCPARLKWRIRYFASRDAMDIDHLGESTVDKLLNVGLVDNISDIYSLNKDDLLKLEGFKEKSVENLLNSIKNSKQRELSRLIYGLGIRHVGKYASQILAKRYTSIDDLAQATEEELKMIDGLGDKSAEAIITFFATNENKALIKNLKDFGVKTKSEKKQNLKLQDKKFIFTGGLTTMSRSKASDLIKRKGGIIASSISKDIDYVILGEKPGSKLDKAKNLNLKIINENEFKKLIS